MLFKSQRSHDADRKTYILTFPTGTLAADRVVAWLRQTTGSLSNGVGRIAGVPTIVFETWATPAGIIHRIGVPWQKADHIASQLRTLIPGIAVVEDASRPKPLWTYAVELGMSDQSRSLRTDGNVAEDVSSSLLASVQTLGDGETVMWQWILTPAVRERMPESAGEPSTSAGITARLRAADQAGHDEVTDRRKKLMHPNLQAVGRIATVATTEARAKHLAIMVHESMVGTDGDANRIRRGNSSRSVRTSVNDAITPRLFPAKFNVVELAPVIGWPIGQPFAPGLPQGATRHLYATQDIARDGILLGHSTYPGHERPIALPLDQAPFHAFTGGKTGMGKSTFNANVFAQVVAQGGGAIVIDASNSDSNESLYSRALNYIPRDRIDDVINVDIDASRYNPVGFNLLDQGSPRIVVDQITNLFTNLYSDTKGVWTKELLFYGLYTLAERPGMTFNDLIPLLTPRTADEVAWADEMIRNVKDPELLQFWQRWTNYSRTDKDRYSQPLLNRAWQLTGRPEIRNIIGQSESSFKMRDVLEGNKILLMSFRGLPPEEAKLIVTLMFNALWTDVQKLAPEKPNFLFLDEVQLIAGLPLGLDDILNRARKHNFPVFAATQYMEDLPAEVNHAIINNTGTRVIFRSSNTEARKWMMEMGRQYVSEHDFTHIRQYEAIAQVANAAGSATPITLKALPPLPATGVAREVVRRSAQRYGRPIEQVQQEAIARRAPTRRQKRRPPAGEIPYDDDED